jgi:hypothetical protein
MCWELAGTALLTASAAGHIQQGICKLQLLLFMPGLLSDLLLQAMQTVHLQTLALLQSLACHHLAPLQQQQPYQSRSPACRRAASSSCRCLQRSGAAASRAVLEALAAAAASLQ